MLCLQKMNHMKKFVFFLIITLSEIIAHAQWIQTNGPTGGNVNCFVFQDTLIFAGTNNGLYISSLNGKTWNTVGENITNKTITSLAVMGQSIFSGTPDGIYSSSDNGLHWAALNKNLTDTSGFTDTSVISLATDTNNIIAGTETGDIFISSDTG